MTEEEAKTKWCPMSRQRVDMIYAADRSEFPELCCIGSACMMWRGLDSERRFGSAGRPPEKLGWSWVPEGSKDVGIEGYWVKDGLCGYCGLAGKP